MKKFITRQALLITSFFMALMFIVPSVAMAQEGTTTIDDSELDSATQGVPERKPVEFEQPKATSGETTTGYTLNGKPATTEDIRKYNENIDKKTRNARIRSGIIATLIVAAAVYYFGFYRKKKKANQNNSPSQNNNQPPQDNTSPQNTQQPPQNNSPQ